MTFRTSPPTAAPRPRTGTAIAPTCLLSCLLPSLLALSLGCGGADATSSTGDAASGRAAEMAEPVAGTAHGKVRGAVEDGIYTFKGIRYGADTATTRFAAPAPPEPWEETADATRFGASCPQTPTGNPGGLFTSWRPDPTPPLSEDCLFLNVWTPGLDDGGARPVMVWLHGGGFASGNGASRAYDGVRLAKRGDVVVVTINHRLNVFGYLALGHHGESFADSPVAGVLDMIQALEWVQANIRAFGGDPDNVMIFGESGGGAKVSTLLATDAAGSLFHRAAMQSGVLVRFPGEQSVRDAADALVANLGLTAENIDQIRTLPTEAIREAAAGTGAGGAPSIDGRLLTRHPFDTDAAPHGRDVPVILGTTRTENSLFMGARDPEVFDLDWAGLEQRLADEFPDRDAAAIVAGYRQLAPEAEPVDVYFEATTDARWLAGHVLVAARKARQGGAPAYLYLFDWDTPVDGGRWRSPHALEIGFVFDNVAYSESMSGVGEEQQRVADVMADTWIAFARNGSPDNPGIPEWPAYDLERRAVMVLDESPEVVDDARAAQRALVGDVDTYLSRYQRD
ncbi:MAG: carboxylesterase/lipase family protein [Acidobacteria bacterium]|nr:MAG: carboxylesterase/lipase family protein [Acidobacteriota bacterium]